MRGLPPPSLPRESHRERRPAAARALERDGRAVEAGGVLDDGKAEARAAHLLGAALVHAVESLENPLPVLDGDADSRVRDGEDRRAITLLHRDRDAAIPAVVLDGVVAQVVDDAREELRDSGDCRAVATHRQRDSARPCRLLKRAHRLPCEREQVALLAPHVGRALVKVREADDVVNEAHHAHRLAVNPRVESGEVIVPHHAAGEKLRRACD